MLDAHQPQLLARADVEVSLAAVPISGDNQPALGVEVSGHLDAVLVQRALR